MGVKVFEGNYVKGVEDGTFKNWYGNGVLKRERFFNMGLMDGFDREYYISGRKKSVEFYNSNFGEKDGTVVILLNAGDKSSQVSDIGRAKLYWKEYLSRGQS